MVVATGVITLDLRGVYGGLGTCLRQAAFQVGSVITTTGYATADFNVWPGLSRAILFALMFIGGCAGSTAGGLKVSCFNNVGPGLGAVGPAGSYADYSVLSKLLLSMAMLMGRLEIYPMLVALSPSVWRKD